MPDISAILAFLYAVLWRYGVLLMVGGLPSLIEKAYEWKYGKSLPHGSYFKWAFVGAALIAVFMAWHDEYEQRLKLEKRETSFNAADNSIKQKDIEIASVKERLHKESEEVRDLKRDILDLKRDKDELREKLGVMTEQHRLTINELLGKLDDRKRHQEIYKNLGVFLERGEILKASLLKETTIPPQVDEIEKWLEEAHSWIRRYMGPAQASLFASPPVLPSYSFGKPQAHENVWNGLERHLHVIRGFLAEAELGIAEHKKTKQANERPQSGF